MGRKTLDESRAHFQNGLFAAGHTQRSAAEALGLSSRTLGRIAAGTSIPAPKHYAWLAREVHPKNPALAEQIAACAGETLTSLGIVAPPPPPPPPPRVPDVELAEVVVCATASLLDVSPNMVRPGLAVAFARAKQLGLSLETMAAVLAKPAPASSDGKRK